MRVTAATPRWLWDRSCGSIPDPSAEATSESDGNANQGRATSGLFGSAGDETVSPRFGTHKASRDTDSDGHDVLRRNTPREYDGDPAAQAGDSIGIAQDQAPGLGQEMGKSCSSTNGDLQRGVGGVLQKEGTERIASGAPWTTAIQALETSEKPSRIPAPQIRQVRWIAPSIKGLLVPGFEWPAGITSLSFDTRIESFRGVPFPESLTQLTIMRTTKASLGRGQISWPSNLQTLYFDCSYNEPLRDAKETWPTSLTDLHLGYMFNQPLSGDGVGLPQGIRTLGFGYRFERSLENVEWPPRLEHIKLCGSMYNLPINRVSWPPTLRKLQLSSFFRQPLCGARWPDSLEELGLFGTEDGLQEGADGRSYLPRRLKKLDLGDSFRGCVGRKTLPDDLKFFSCSGHFRFSPSVQWPQGLMTIRGGVLGGECSNMPPNLEILMLREVSLEWTKVCILPATLKVLEVDGW